MRHNSRPIAPFGRHECLPGRRQRQVVRGDIDEDVWALACDASDLKSIGEDW